MFRKTLLPFLAVSLLFTLAANAQTTSAKLTAAQVVEKNVAARGGLHAWKSVQAISWKGKMDAGTGDSAARSRALAMGKMQPASKRADATPESLKSDANAQVQLPFLLEKKRGRKERWELEFQGKTGVQVYDGANGWKIRPWLNRLDAEPFTPEELKAESNKADLDGYLIDYAAKGTKVELAGAEKVEGNDAYKLKLTLKSGDVQYVWIDQQSFLDVKVSGTPRRMDGKMHDVFIYQRDFKTVDGLVMPFVLETAVDGYRDTHKLMIESVVVNPKLDDSLFMKPQAK